MSEYIANGMVGSKPATYAVCSACHGEDGKGVPYVGPNIVEYDDALISAVLHDGKKGLIGMMPNFKGRLNPTQDRALAAYIRSIGE